MIVDFPDMGGGIISDLPPEQLARNQWSEGNNVRFIRARVERMSGFSEVFGTASASGTIGTLAKGNAHWMMHIDDSSGDPWWVYCDLEKIYATDGTTHYDISNSATSTASMTSYAATADYKWNGGEFNGLAIINSHAQAPRYWSPDTSTQTIELSNWPASTTCRVLRPYLNYLIAIGLDEGAGFNDNILRWSHPADVGALPSSWDYTDATVDAGRIEIDDGYGMLVDGQQLRNDFFVYAEHAIYRLTPIPGNAIFDVRRQFSEVGLLTRNCIATIKDSHVFIGDGDIYIQDGQEIRSIVTDKWKAWVFDNIGDNWKRSYVVTDYVENEVLFCIPTGAEEYPTKALVWDFDGNTFTTRDLIGTSKGGASFMAVGKIPDSTDDTFDGGPDIAFDEESLLPFDHSYANINQQKIVMAQLCSSSASVSFSSFFQINSGLYYDTDNYTAYAKKDCLPLGRDGRFNLHDEYQIHAIWPRIRSGSGGNITVRVGMRDTVDEAITWTDSATFVIGTNKKVDVRATGTVCTVQFESQDAFDWELNGFSVEYDVVGSSQL